jgi:hypothetical protein
MHEQLAGQPAQMHRSRAREGCACEHPGRPAPSTTPTEPGRARQVSDRLAERNRRLRGVHGQLGRVVVGLMETDLVRHKDRCVFIGP